METQQVINLLDDHYFPLEKMEQALIVRPAQVELYELFKLIREEESKSNMIILGAQGVGKVCTAKRFYCYVMLDIYRVGWQCIS